MRKPTLRRRPSRSNKTPWKCLFQLTAEPSFTAESESKLSPFSQHQKRLPQCFSQLSLHAIMWTNLNLDSFLRTPTWEPLQGMMPCSDPIKFLQLSFVSIFCFFWYGGYSHCAAEENFHLAHEAILPQVDVVASSLQTVISHVRFRVRIYA